MYTKPLLILSLLAAIMLLATSCGGGGGSGGGSGGGTVDLTLSISAAEVSVTEGQSTSFVVSLDRANDTGSTIAGTIAFTDSSDLTPTGTTSTLYVISNGAQSDSVTVSIWDDNLIENTETLTADLGDPNVSGVSLGTNTATVEIIQSPVTASLSVQQHGNEAGSSPVQIVYLLTLAKVNNTGLPITFGATLTGTASPTLTTPADYVTPSLMEISVADGATTAVFTVSIQNDDEPDENENLSLTIANSSHSAINIVTDTATADILDSTKSGQFKLRGNVQGLDYKSGSLTGTTTTTGTFTYVVGETVTFTFAGITLGTTIGKRIITPVDLVENGSVEDYFLDPNPVVNITRYLLLLDHNTQTPEIEIDGADRSAALSADWATDNNINPTGLFQKKHTDFANALNNGLKVALETVDPANSHTLPAVGAAVFNTLRVRTIDCIYAGIYKGEFNRGDGSEGDYGPIGIIMHANMPGAMAYNLARTESYYIFEHPVIISLVTYDQKAEFPKTGGYPPLDNTKKVWLTGNFTSVEAVEGTWTARNPILRGGTYTATRVGGDWDANWRLVGMIAERPLRVGGEHRGLFDLQLLEDGANSQVTGGALYWIGDQGWVESPISLTASTFTNGQGLKAVFEDGTEINTGTGVININRGRFVLPIATTVWKNLTFTNPVNNGRVAISYGCLLNN